LGGHIVVVLCYSCKTANTNVFVNYKLNENSAHRDANTAHWQSQKYSPRRRPPSRGAGWPKFNQLEIVITFTYRPSLVKIDACNFELSW